MATPAVKRLAASRATLWWLLQLVPRRVVEAHARPARVFAHVCKGHWQGDSSRIAAHGEVQVRREAAADVAARGDALPLLNALPTRTKLPSFTKCKYQPEAPSPCVMEMKLFGAP